MVLNFNNPIEQFNIFTIFCMYDHNFTWFFYFIFFCFFCFILNLNYIKFDIIHSIYFMRYLINNRRYSLKFINEISFIPSQLQYIFEIFVINFVIFYKSLINWKNRIFYFSIFFTGISFILFSNLLGLIPYSFALTAQLFVTLNLSLYFFISFNIIGISIHKLELFNLFIPKGVNLLLEFILVPIEFISYIFRPISLSIRLFANIMAGHTLLKVICNFILKFFKMDFFIIFNFIPFFLLVILFCLELFVALIQSYVFFILISLFLKDIIKLDH